MESGDFWLLGHVSDAQLRSALLDLLTIGARTEARIVAHLAEVEERRLHLRDGYSSMFDYCLSRLGLSESEAFHRITAARLAQRFPSIFGLLERRELHLSGLRLLRDHLTVENHAELLTSAIGKSKFQIQELLARRFPRPEIEATVRKLPTRSSADGVGRFVLPSSEVSIETERVLSQSLPLELTGAVSMTVPQCKASAKLEPVADARYRLQLDMSVVMREKLELCRALLSHSIPNGDLATVLERGLDALLEKTQRQRFAQTKSPKRGAEIRGVAVAARADASRREHIPNATRREVAARDGLCCTYVSADGKRCSAQAFLEIHHEHPWARGGASTTNNLRMLCAAHNRLLAERDFGRALVRARRKARQAAPI